MTRGNTTSETPRQLGQAVDLLRLDASRMLHPDVKSSLGQYFTPMAVAQLMASMFEPGREEVRLLDAGAGVGSLFAAVVEEALSRGRGLRRLAVTAYEVDRKLLPYLRETVRLCEETARVAGVQLSVDVLESDFLSTAVHSIRGELFESPTGTFDWVILNPPYKKFATDSPLRRLLRSVGIETSNLYTAFLAVATRLLVPGGELVAITPRSFCNGPYFRPFRRDLMDRLGLRRIHVFESREKAFSEDEVLQENVIVHAARETQRPNVVISSSMGPHDETLSVHEVPFEEVVRPDDPESFIRVVSDGLARSIARRVSGFRTTLEGLGVSVSTGRVVDFRARPHLRARPSKRTAPLIYPLNFARGFVEWPKEGGRKPQAIVECEGTEDLLVPSATYVLVKRFSAKEERRRVAAAVFDPRRVRCRVVGFENHLNYFHGRGRGLSPRLAKGLAAFLNSTLIDEFFRQFNGHTQVNATDLRNLPYPRREQLEALGARIGRAFPTQDELDALIESEFTPMADPAEEVNGVLAKKRIEEALAVLKQLGLPHEQQNERSALTLLALLDLKPDTPWEQAGAPLMGITPLMDYFKAHYGKAYAPNTRETVRRQTVHQFLDAGLIVENPDDPERPVNSPRAVYQISPAALELLRTVGTEEWVGRLQEYLAVVGTLTERYARERAMKKIPLVVSAGKTIELTPGGQNVLVERVVNEFCPRFTPGAKVIYVGDTGDKFAHFDEQGLANLGVTIESHGPMPDVVVYDEARNWLVLIEAVTSHGPVNPKRRRELEDLFEGASAGLVFVTAFMDRKALLKYLSDISWETEVWVAESPSHMIHFNGERFLGPYPPGTEE